MQMSMENYQAAGDLTDIVRASGGGGSSIPPNNNEPIISSGSSDWRFPSSSDLMNFQSGILGNETATTDDFGDPFSDLRDPLLHELHHIGSSAAGGFFFNTPPQNSAAASIDLGQETNRVFGVAQKTINSRRLLDDDDDIEDDQMMMMMMKRSSASCNIFSRMLQISPNNNAKTTATLPPLSPCGSPVQQLQAATAAASPSSSRGSIINANNSSSKGCNIVDNTTCLQISSPRNPGIKRRKSQAKKVVCIPAPAPANSRPSGEIVPSDLWAWRKYGQKPIKGSPYPRGYYRCSSSKGCSARKQVERSRTDPNMLVITYTSEHNHPWPTQRNALAGSTRAQPLKSNNNAAAASQSSQIRTTTNLNNEEFKDINNNISSDSIVAGSSSGSGFVKEEMEDMEDEKEILEMDEGDHDQLISEQGNFPPSYKPSALNQLQQPGEDFFADLEEIEGTDPLSLLLLNQEFRSSSGDHDDHHHQAEMRGINKALDPFSIFDWPSGNKNT